MSSVFLTDYRDKPDPELIYESLLIYYKDFNAAIDIFRFYCHITYVGFFGIHSVYSMSEISDLFRKLEAIGIRYKNIPDYVLNGPEWLADLHINERTGFVGHRIPNELAPWRSEVTDQSADDLPF
jgi:hypothetical protein